MGVHKTYEGTAQDVRWQTGGVQREEAGYEAQVGQQVLG